MATAWTYDTTNKLFVLQASALDGNGNLEINAQQAYSIVKQDWLLDDSLNKFKFPLNSIGGQDIGGGSFIAAYIQLKTPWKIQMPEADANITIIGNVITEDGGDPFADVAGPYHHVIKYVVSANSFNTSQAALENELADVATAINTIDGSVDTLVTASSYNGALLQDVDNEVDTLVTTTIPNLASQIDTLDTSITNMPQTIWNFANGVETGLTPAQALQVLTAVAAGKASISGNTVTFRDINDARNVVTSATDGAGQRLTVTINVT